MPPISQGPPADAAAARAAACAAAGAAAAVRTGGEQQGQGQQERPAWRQPQQQDHQQQQQQQAFGGGDAPRKHAGPAPKTPGYHVAYVGKCSLLSDILPLALALKFMRDDWLSCKAAQLLTFLPPHPPPNTPLCTSPAGNVAWEADDKALARLFEPCGVIKVRLHTDKDTGKPKGFAHVHFK